MTEMTILEQLQNAVSDINCVHPDTAITGLQAVFARIGGDSPDSGMIQRAIDRLEKLAEEMAKVERSLAAFDFSFGQFEEV